MNRTQGLGRWPLATCLLAAGVVLGGCTGPETLDPGVALSPNAYTVTVKILEYGKKTAALLTDGKEKTLTKVMSDKNTLVTTLPTLHLQPGDRKEVDQRKEYPFLVALGTNGTPNRYDSVTAGEYLRVTLTLMPSGAPALGIQLDAPRVVGWDDVLGPGGILYKHPRTDTTLVNSTLSPPWSTWQIADQEPDGVVIVRIDRPTLSPPL